MITASAFDSVFEPLIDQVPVDHQLAESWQILCDWLKPKQFLPGPEVLRALGDVDLFASQLIHFYEQAMRIHFMKHARPALSLSKMTKSCEEDAEEIASVSAILRQAKHHYAYPLYVVEFPIQFRECFQQLFSALVRLTIPFSVLTTKLNSFFQCHPLRNLDEKGVEVYRSFVESGLDEEVELILAELVLAEVKDYIRKKFAGQWDRPVFQEYIDWLEEVIIPCVETVLGRKEDIRQKLTEIGANTLVDLRIEELFDIVVDFPDSEAALREFKTYLKKPAQRANTVFTFQQSCAHRLLQGGANTVDIISGYISTIKAFHILDPRGILLDKVSRPIRRYLKDREDTISVLVCGLLGDEDSDVRQLADELANSKSQLDEKDVDDLLDLNWVPDPVDAPPDFIKPSSLDVVDSLISMYDSKEVFVKELAMVLANRMLSQSIGIEELIMKIEFLKLRFGDRALQSLDVMVRDMSESTRINSFIHKVSRPESPIGQLSVSILSRLFWPTFKQLDLKLPPAVEEQLAVYEGNFSGIQQGRKLDWIRNLGLVSLTLDLADRSLQIQVTPQQASVITLFEEEGSKSVDEIASLLNLESSVARADILFWVSKGILKSSNEGRYYVLETVDETEETMQSDEIAGASVQGAVERATEEMRVYWSYIVGMLKNLGACSVEKIHSFLKVLVPAEQMYSRSQEDLEQYLNLMVEEEKLEINGNLYSLPK